MASDDSDETGSFYIFIRIVQIITLIVTFSLLASVVAAYNHAGLPVPGSILCLFIVAVLLTVWSLCILITYLRANNVDYTIAFLDLVGMVALIVGVALLANAANQECINISTAAAYAGTTTAAFEAYLQSHDIGLVTDNGNYGAYCSLLKAAWGLGIANIFFFFLTALSGYQIASAFQQQQRRRNRGYGGDDRRSRTIVEEEIGGPVPVIVQPAMREVVIEETVPRRKKSDKRKSSGSKHKRRDSDRDRDRRRSSRSNYDN